MTRILIIDDNQAVLNFLRIFCFKQASFRSKYFKTALKHTKLSKINSLIFYCLIWTCPMYQAWDILKYLYEHKIKLTTIVLTGVEDIDLAVQSMKLGTFDYLLKPIEEDKLLETLENAKQKFDYTREETTVSTEKEVTTEGLKFPKHLKKSLPKMKKMLKIFHYVEKFASTDNSVLIWGESGVGKELIARAIHKISIRRDKKFIAVNAGAFAQELFSSEFFGYEKGLLQVHQNKRQVLSKKQMVVLYF
jgi:two-component system response regulator HydG